MEKIARIFWGITQGMRLIVSMFAYLFQGLLQRTFLLRSFNLIKALQDATRELIRDSYITPHSAAVQKLKKTTQGLHALLPHDKLYSYSILMPVYKPKASYFKTALESVLNQTAPSMEVLVGFDGPQPQEVYQVVEELAKQYPGILRSFQLDRNTQGGSISATTNYLAEHAQGNFLLLVDHDDWIRPDLLFRYEQTLRLLANPQNSVLYCNEYKINEKDLPIPLSGLKKPLRPPFPYLFLNLICHCLLVPKLLWKRIGGLRVVCNGAQDYDLALRLDIAGAELHNVPFFLYAWRVHAESTAGNASQKHYAISGGLKAIADYVKAKQLDWQVVEGLKPTTYRAIPYLHKIPSIHVIIPYKDQKELTIKAVQSVLRQTGVLCHITAVNNNSQDNSIANELEKLGVEVLTINEPFNYSRLNNLAVEQSSLGNKCELLLFLNNDVELDEGALQEMSRWIEQPQIGIVGCRLHFPNGLLQHGGLDLSDQGPENQLIWASTEKNRPLSALFLTRVLRTVDAVTAACALIKRQVFLDVGGFDEIWYPIAYSDTNLAVKLKAKGLFSLYTPYASGIHHESISRKENHIEDYEMSRWLHEKCHKLHAK